MVQASCENCGDVELYLTDVTVTTFAGLGAQYRFDCPSCHKSVLKPAQQRIVDILRNAGGHVIDLDAPAELREHPANAPAITEDDIARFTAALDAEP